MLHRFAPSKAPRIAFPIPSTIHDFDVQESQLSEKSRQLILPKVEEFQNLGFRRLVYRNAGRVLSIEGEDGAAAFLLHESNLHFAVVTYARIGRRENSTLAVTSFFKPGGALSTTTRTNYFDPVDGIVCFLKTDSALQLFRYHIHKLGSQADSLIKFRNEGDFWMHLQELVNQEHTARFKRGLYVQMTPEQVDILQRQVAAQSNISGTDGRRTPPSQRFAMIKWVTIFVAIALGSIISFKGIFQTDSSFDQINWMGQTFKLTKRYPDYEGYKEASHQVPKSEAERIMKIMLSIEVPKRSLSLKILNSSLPELKFPGYGSTYNGNIRDEKGERYVLFEYQIPETEKLRSSLYKVNKDSGTCELVLDTVAVDHPKDHSVDDLQVRVEDHQLRHYRNGTVYREASLEKNH